MPTSWKRGIGAVAKDWPLWLLLCIAFSLRLFWAMAETGAIENEGAEYARIAENLVAGRGYVGTMDGPQLLFPPLLPLLIALGTFITGNSEVAGRAVSILAGTLLVVPVFCIGRQLHGRRVGLLAAGLTAVHPALIELSAAVYSEGIAITLVMGGACLTLRALDGPGLKHAVWAGVLFGLAYLTRPEAAAYAVVGVVWLLVLAFFGRDARKQRLGRAAAIAVVGVIVALPYVCFLYVHTGRLAFEGKGHVNYVIGQRIQRGMTFDEAAFGLDEALGEAPLLNPRAFVHEAHAPRSAGDLARYVASAASKNLRAAYHEFFGARVFLAPALLLLTLIGWFRNGWDRRRSIQESFLLALLVTMLVPLVAVQHLWPRFLYQFLPVLLVWSAKGLEELDGWARLTLGGFRRSLPPPRWLSAGALGVATAAVISAGTVDLAGTRSLGDARRAAGQWLSSHAPGARRIMDAGTIVPYYAHTTWLPLPHGEPGRVLRYVSEKRPDFIVLAGQRGAVSYLDAWAHTGVADLAARIVYRARERSGEEIVVVRWAYRGP